LWGCDAGGKDDTASNADGSGDTDPEGTDTDDTLTAEDCAGEYTVEAITIDQTGEAWATKGIPGVSQSLVEYFFCGAVCDDDELIASNVSRRGDQLYLSADKGVYRAEMRIVSESDPSPDPACLDFFFSRPDATRTDWSAGVSAPGVPDAVALDVGP